MVEASVAICDFSITLKNNSLYAKFIRCLFFFLNMPLMATTNSDTMTLKADVISTVYTMHCLFVL